MIKEIGGYMELEKFSGREYYENLHRFNLGRTALVWFLKKNDCRKIYIPIYNCDSVANSVKKAGIEVEGYHVDESLSPDFKADFALNENEWLYIINYFGQLDEGTIKEYKDRFGNIIIDNAQAFFEKPVGDIPTLYSCRKFLGVSDGAYLSTDMSHDDNLERDISKDRIGYLLGRLEEDARSHYSSMLDESSKFTDEIPRKMSRLTQHILEGIDYEKVRRKRLENYRILKELLPSDNPFNVREPLGPFAYPYYCENGIELRKALAAESIFVPTNWTYLTDSMPKGSVEYDWSANILPLPVDQRYSEEEMEYLADVIKRLSKC